ncbi:unnamed protein product [Strongylus vulgaris]|uniref:Uncharacterized protein n=1 Tax=Strongylus vulgaris TaxID=40348 RepID=A0A3P7LJ88_STRVU|nr:unnamed protein product [Strongylus vulgaris]
MNARMSRLRRSLSRSVHQLSLSRSNSLNGLIELPTSSYTTLVDKFAVSSLPIIDLLIYSLNI